MAGTWASAEVCTPCRPQCHTPLGSAEERSPSRARIRARASSPGPRGRSSRKDHRPRCCGRAGPKRKAAQEDLALREGLAGLGLRLTTRLPHARAGLGSRQRRFTSEGEGWTRRGGPRRSSSFTGRKLPLSLPPRAKRRPGGMLPAPSPRALTSHECVPSGLFLRLPPSLDCERLRTRTGFFPLHPRISNCRNNDRHITSTCLLTRVYRVSDE